MKIVDTKKEIKYITKMDIKKLKRDLDMATYRLFERQLQLSNIRCAVAYGIISLEESRKINRRLIAQNNLNKEQDDA
jgi:hypothetical protein